jgi:hypothetical protein
MEPKGSYLPPVSVLNHINPVHTTPPYAFVFLVISFLLAFPPIVYVFSSSPFMLHILPTSFSLTSFQLHFAKRASYEAIIMQFSPTFCHIISLWAKYSPQHPVLKHLLSMFLPCVRHTPTQNHGHNYSLIY